MKRFWKTLCASAVSVSLAACGQAGKTVEKVADAKKEFGCDVLNVYNAGEYIGEDVVSNFETMYDARVNYDTFESNEMMYTKLLGGASYDVLVPSDYMIEQLLQENMLQKLDMSMFTTDNVYTMCQMFEGCASLKTIEGMDRWNTANVTDMSEMFNSNSRGMSLEYVDFSTFDTSKLKVTFSMFAGCGQLHTVYVGDGWDLSGVTSSGGMFSGCGKLVGGNGTTTAGKATDKTFACVDTPETPGFLTYKEN